MILAVLIISFIVIAIHVTYQEGEIFEFVSAWGEKHISEKWQKPVFACPKCMIPYYGTPIYLIGHYTDVPYFADARIQTIAFVLIAAIGITTMYLNIMNAIEES